MYNNNNNKIFLLCPRIFFGFCRVPCPSSRHNVKKKDNLDLLIQETLLSVNKQTFVHSTTTISHHS